MNRITTLCIAVVLVALLGAVARAQFLPEYKTSSRAVNLRLRVSTRRVNNRLRLSADRSDIEQALSMRRVDVKQRPSARRTFVDRLSSPRIIVDRKVGAQFPTPQSY